MRKIKTNVRIKISRTLHSEIFKDLNRSHPFASERVGFLFTKSKRLVSNEVLVFGAEYMSVDDLDYIIDPDVGAKINASSIRKAMQKMFDEDWGCFHVHLHDHNGNPSPSFTDTNSLPGVANSFANIRSKQANGYLILSKNSGFASIKISGEKDFINPQLISVIGNPMLLSYSFNAKQLNNDVFKRQSFLGKDSQFLLENVRVAIIGYGGGGSHIGQQLAHIGVKNITVFDDDKIEDSNHNRLIGAWFKDLKKALLKSEIAKRTIKKILPTAKITTVNKRWQECPELLQACDIVFGNVDSYLERQQLEAECRRYLIPLIDIGMDVNKFDGGSHSMSGQVILSMPGTACMHCYGFLTEEKLEQEAAKYGTAGGRPQVVWPNGVLASTAIGVFMDLVTGWSGIKKDLIYLSYDGNNGTLTDHIRLKFVPQMCQHYLITECGEVVFKKI